MISSLISFLHIVETMIVSIASGIAFTAVFFFLFKQYPQTDEGKAFLKTLYTILKTIQWSLLCYFIVVSIVIYINHSIVDPFYFLRIVAVLGIVISGFCMTKKLLSPKNGVIFTAGGWTYISLIAAILFSTGYAFNISSGLLVYGLCLLFYAFVIRLVFYIKERKQ